MDAKDTKQCTYIPPEATEIKLASEGVMTNIKSKMDEDDLFNEGFN